MRKILVAVLAAGLCIPLHAQDKYDAKIADLISRMTVEEKFGQLQQLDGEANGDSRPEHFELAKKGMLGSTLNVRGVERVNALQKAALEARLKIPILFAFDVIHGYRTVFPVPLAETASFDPELARSAASIAAAETRASGVRWTFAPMMDISRDPRWGRIVEGSGEDTYLGSVMAAARIKGFQGDDYSAPGKVAACAKHFAGYGAVEAGRDYNGTTISGRNLFDYYFPPFKASVDAGVATFMTSFNDLNGVPSTGNSWLVRGVLKSSWNFDGMVVSDYTSVQELVSHGLAADDADAARLALAAGTDMEMVSRTYAAYGPELLKKGLINEKQLDEAVMRVLRVKFRAGLFDNPYGNTAEEKKVVSAPAYLKAARAAAAKTFVLLKNDNNTLPVKPGVKSILVAGALADDKAAPLGNWTGDGKPEDTPTILSGLQAGAKAAGSSLTYVRGAGPFETDKDDIAAATAAANSADYIIAVIGEDPVMSGEAASRSDLSLPGRQLELVKALQATGKPVAVLLMTGRPVIINWLAENVPAIMEIWYPGSQAGNAVADVVFGKVSPGAKLPVTWLRSVGQIPLYYNHKNTGRPFDATNRYTSKYIDVPNTPLYPFGYGLSYSTFTLSGLALSASTITLADTLTVTGNVTNTGNVTADEVVQLYIRDVAASSTRPVRELKGFTRVTLKPGETKPVKFTLSSRDLGFFGPRMKFITEPGLFKVWLGTSSEGGLESSFFVAE